eukprot:scaffold1401_cov330-Pavlova_lutheri.AAC.62
MEAADMAHGMAVLESEGAMRAWVRKQKDSGKTVGFVPTMGYLHEGHLRLVDEAKQHADVVVASIYVNPTQFAPGEDFDVYPRDVEGDRKKLEARHTDCIFSPRTLYAEGQGRPGEGETSLLARRSLSKQLCGKSRPHFFGGVCTVLAKLFHIVTPDVAVFGKKDYQQWRVIQAMVEDLHFDIQVIGAPLVRDEDGLALSSRNARLSFSQRSAALAIPQSLFAAKESVVRGEKDAKAIVSAVQEAIQHNGGQVDYIEVVDATSLEPVQEVGASPALIAVAAQFGDVRLIDNLELPPGN